MARLPRVYVEGAIYYVTCRGAHNEELFRDEGDYKMYVELLEKYRKEYGYKLFAYVLLPTHLHLLIEPSKENEIGISEIMRSLNTAYPKYFNNRHNRRGHLFRERFKATLVEKDSYLLKLISYIHFNPVRIGRVQNPQEYPYCSFTYYKDRCGDRLEVKEIMERLGQVQYCDYLGTVKPEDIDLHKRLQRGGILGSKEFAKNVREEIQRKEKESQAITLPKKYRVYLGVSGTLMVLSLIGAAAVMKFVPKGPGVERGFIETPVFVIEDIEDLKATEWEVKFTPTNEEAEAFTDTINFAERKFASAKFSSEGFRSTNYSATQEGERIIWETIQTKDNSTLSWRGEIDGSKMQGILSLRSPDGMQDFLFTSIRQRRK
ncbi:MAG: transposase [Candidatus Omnitrophota bacterium]|nr:MAG: transposase [Candidatus Omnitrophota bacterium]